MIKKQNDIQEDNRTTSLNIIGNPRDFEFDKNYLNLIIDNLISNAFKYSKNCQAPDITLVFLSDALQLTIKDYGIGIPVVEQAQIFKSFFRASNTQNIKGTGIGLVLVHYFIELHEGTIQFESIQNKGTQFTINLPYSSTKDKGVISAKP